MSKWPSTSGNVSDRCTNPSDMPIDFEGEDEPMVIEGGDESMVIEGENMPCSLKSVSTSVSETLSASIFFNSCITRFLCSPCDRHHHNGHTY